MGAGKHGRNTDCSIGGIIVAVVLITNSYRYVGLSGDTKPTGVPAGSVFYETDTKDIYMFDGTDWHEGRWY